jgi:3-phenylpropionate/trans-cinnamate dioxygenase ferredoxin reductase subunit
MSEQQKEKGLAALTGVSLVTPTILDDGSRAISMHTVVQRIFRDQRIPMDVEKAEASGVRSVDGVLSSLRALSPQVMEVGIRIEHALGYRAGQYAQLRFEGYPSRPFSITHPLSQGNKDSRLIWFHIRHMENGRVTSLLGKRIMLGHRVKLTGPYGSAYFQPNMDNRLILVAADTGFAPIWSIAAAALYENPSRQMLIVAAGETIESFYMGPALRKLARFPNVRVVPICSTPQNVTRAVRIGHPTDFLTSLEPTDVVHVCGAPQMVEAVEAIAMSAGAICFADPFVRAAGDPVEEDDLSGALRWPAMIKRIAPIERRSAKNANRRKRLRRPKGNWWHGLESNG